MDNSEHTEILREEKRKYLVKEKTYELKIKELQEKIKDLESELNQLHAKDFFLTPKELKMKILELRARAMNTYSIYEFLASNGIDISYNVVENTINNIKYLAPDLYAYYMEQKEIFEKQIKINPETIRQITIDNILRNIDRNEKLIADSQNDPAFVKVLLDSNSEYNKALMGAIKNIEAETVAKQVANDIEEMKRKMDEKSQNIIKFGLGTIKSV